MANRNYRVGFIITDTPGDVKWFYASPTALNNYDVFKSAGATYQVTAGKTLYIGRLILATDTASTFFRIYYGDDAISNAAGPPTNEKQLTNQLDSPTANASKSHDILLTIPASKYGHFKSLTASATCLGNGGGIEI